MSKSNVSMEPVGVYRNDPATLTYGFKWLTATRQKEGMTYYSAEQLVSKDAEIAILIEANFITAVEYETCNEELRASNEKLVAAEARIVSMVNYIKLVNPGHMSLMLNNLTALRQHDAAIKAEVIESVSAMIGAHCTMQELVDWLITQ